MHDNDNDDESTAQLQLQTQTMIVQAKLEADLESAQSQLKKLIQSTSDTQKAHAEQVNGLKREIAALTKSDQLLRDELEKLKRALLSAAKLQERNPNTTTSRH